MSESRNGWTVHDWAKEIRAVYRKTVEASITIGQLLLQAKAALGHGQFKQMFVDLPFDIRMGEVYMSVAENSVLANPKHVSQLPLSIATLYILSRVEPLRLEQALEDRVIHPELRRDDAKQLFTPTVPPTTEWTLAEAENRLRLAINAEVLQAPAQRDQLIALLRRLTDELENGANPDDVQTAFEELDIHDSKPGGFKVFEDNEVVASAKSTYPDWYKTLTHHIDGASALRRTQIEQRLSDLQTGILPTKRTQRSHLAVSLEIRGEARRAGMGMQGNL
jgi:hypothetical protein